MKQHNLLRQYLLQWHFSYAELSPQLQMTFGILINLTFQNIETPFQHRLAAKQGY